MALQYKEEKSNWGGRPGVGVLLRDVWERHDDLQEDCDE